MASLFCFGLGYCAERFIGDHGGGYTHIAGTVRAPEKAALIAAERIGGYTAETLVFGGDTPSPAVAAALRTTRDLLVSIAPDRNGDPVLRHFAEDIAAAPVRTIVYLSTIGVYGDHGGAWIDESAAMNPQAGRNRARIAAEAAWRRLADASGKRLSVLRLAGIYGPGQNALVSLARGDARRIVKAGQVFNRIHVADIATAVAAAFARAADGVFNVADDEPAPAEAVVAYAASLLGVAPPPATDFEVAAKAMTPMALSFYGEVKRVRNTKMARELGVRLRFPTYREGLRALYEENEGCVPASPA